MDNSENRSVKASKTQRDSNIELFRIISMLLIVAHHYVVNSGLAGVDGPIYSDPMSPRSLFLLLFGAWGKIGINCFVLITGYFMCKSTITLKKFIKLLFEIMFYKLVISGIFWVSGYSALSVKAFIKALLPITSIAQNFTGTYILFFLCIPFLNILISNMTEKQHIKLILLSTFIYVFFGTIPFFKLSMNYISWYMVLYFIASYLRLYPKKIFDSKCFWGMLTLVSVLLSAISVVACTWLGTKINRNMSFAFVTDSNTFLALLTGVSSFMLFRNMKIKYSKVINTISSTTFGILLIHANSETMRQWLWKDVLDNIGAYDSSYMPIHAIGSVLLIFTVCSILDLIRIHLVEVPFFKMWDKYYPRINAKLVSIGNKLCQKAGIDS